MIDIGSEIVDLIKADSTLDALTGGRVFDTFSYAEQSLPYVAVDEGGTITTSQIIGSMEERGAECCETILFCNVYGNTQSQVVEILEVLLNLLAHTHLDGTAGLPTWRREHPRLLTYGAAKSKWLGILEVHYWWLYI